MDVRQRSVAVVFGWALSSSTVVHAAPTAFASVVNADAPSLYYRFNETSGDFANLGTLGATHAAFAGGTVTRGVASFAGDTAVSFNGADDRITSIGSAPANFTGNPSFTAEAIFKVQDFAQLWPPLLHWGAGGTGKEVYFSLQNNNEDRLYAGFYNGGLRTTGTIPQNTWLHAVWTRAGGGNSSTGSTLYLNGVPVPLQNDPDLPANMLTPAVVATAFHINFASDFTRYFIGAIDELALYPRVLTAGEVAEHFAASGLALLAGDYNASGSVEQGDLDLVLNNWGGPRGTWANADSFSSGAVDQEELDRVLNNWGSSSAPGFSANPGVVPEPGVIGMLSLVAVGVMRRPR